MPLVDGIEATRRIREHRPTACILMLTGSNIAAEIDRSRQAGAAGYLTKDRVGPQLVEAILDLGSARRRRRGGRPTGSSALRPRAVSV